MINDPYGDQPAIDDGTTDPTADPNIAAQTRRSLVVPGNVMPWIEDASDEFGVPRDLLAAVIYQHSRFGGLTPGLIAQVAARIAESYDRQSYQRHTYPGEDEQNETEVWLDAATEYAHGTTESAVARAYRTELARVYGDSRLVDEIKAGRRTGKTTLEKPTGITLGADIKLPSGKFTTSRFPGGIGGSAAYGPGGSGGGPAAAKPIIPGLTDDQATAVQRVADPLFLKYYGRFPRNDEYIDISRKGFTQQTLEQHLRAQANPSAPGFNVGQTFDARDIANKWANSVLGRDASEGEVNFLLTNKVPINDDHFSAFFTQIRDHAVWQGDPVKWLEMQRRLQAQWNKLGLSGDVDANTVNDAIAGNWTDQQAADHFRAMPAPGHPPGTTVGEVERLRAIATSVKQSLFPGEPVTDTELQALRGMSPDQILQHYRSIVPPNSQTGLPVGIESDYRSMAESVLSRYGVVGYDVTPEDLKFFALTKADPEAILAHLAEKPELQKAYPGLRYGMQSEDFKAAVNDLTGAFQGAFPGATLGTGGIGGAKDSSLLGAALTDKVGASEFGDIVERFRQETGSAPSAAQFRERRNRPSTKTPSQGSFPEQAPPTPRERDPQQRQPRAAVSRA